MLRSENASSLLPFSAGGDAVTCENNESQQTICFSFSFSFTGLFFFIFFFVLDLFLSTDLFFFLSHSSLFQVAARPGGLLATRLWVSIQSLQLSMVGSCLGEDEGLRAALFQLEGNELA